MTIGDPRADLRLLLPLAKGRRALLPTGEPALAAALAADGLRLIEQAGLPWSLAAQSLDYVLLPGLPGALSEHIVEAARVLRPGGYLLLGVTNRRSLYRWSGDNRAGYAAAGLRQVSRLLARRGFRLESCYGVRDSLARPLLRVSLAAPGPTEFYFRSRFTPHTRSGALLGRLARPLSYAGAQSWLYPALLLVACRLPETPRSSPGGAEEFTRAE